MDTETGAAAGRDAQYAWAPLGGIIPSFGGKRTLAPRILELALGDALPRTYAEPFHLSLAVLLELRRRGFEGPAWVNDKFNLVSNLAKVLAHDCYALSLYEQVLAQPFHEGILEEAQRGLSLFVDKYADLTVPLEPPSIPLAYNFLVASWMGRNGEVGLKKSLRNARLSVRWTQSGGDPALRWDGVKHSLPWWYQRMSRKTTFLGRDALDLLEDLVEEEGLFLYCAPPYLKEARGGAEYAVDVTDFTGTAREGDDFHSLLAAGLHRFRRGTVAISFYQHERLARLYPVEEGWVHHRLTVNKATAQSRAGAAKVNAPEVLIMRKGSSCVKSVPSVPTSQTID